MKIDEKYLDEIAKKISAQVSEILDNKVAPQVKKIQRQKINEVVYDRYDPSEYQRRRNRKGGLLWGASTTMHRAKSVYDSELVLYNKATASMQGELATFKEDLPYLIEFGDGAGGYEYDYPFNSTATEHLYREPRPFMEATYDEIKSSQIVEKTLARNLRKHGYKVKLM